MIYTVGEMAKMLDVPASTLRYYDKEGLLPFVERSPGGIRMFQESDYGWLKIISCKLASAGGIESRSSGMKGTYIKVLNDVVFDELAKVKVSAENTSGTNA